MKKILSLLCLMMLTMTSAWAGEATFNLGTKNGVSTPEGFFKSVGEKWNWNTKFNGAEYDGISFSQGLKMEGTTKIGFTTTAVSKVTIVQSTWSDYTIKFDDTELAVTDATAGTGCRIYTIENVAVGDHVISRGSGENGLFYVKVEWSDEVIITNKNIILNATNWGASDARYAVYAFNSDEDNTWINFAPTAQNGYYATQVGDNYANIILVRMNGSTTENNWDNKWNQTDNIDFTAIADGTIFTVTFVDGQNSAYTTSNPLQEAKDKLTKVIAMATLLDSGDLTDDITTAQDALASSEATAETLAAAAQTLITKVKPVAATFMSELNTFANNYGYTEISQKIASLTALMNAEQVDIDAVSVAANELINDVRDAAPEIIGKVEGYATGLEDAVLNAAIQTAKTTASSTTSSVKEVVAAAKAAVDAFKTAAAAYVEKVAGEGIEDETVQAKLAAIAALGDNPSLAAYGEALRQLIVAYQAYQLEQNPVYTVAGTTALTGYNWDTSKNLMTLNQETGLYEWTAKFITVPASGDEELKFKVVRNYNWDTSWPENDWVITENTFEGGAGVYTITITFNAESKDIAVSGVKREMPEFADNNIYYWESPDGYADQNRGVATAKDKDGNDVTTEDINIVNDKYNVIRLRGGKDFKDNVVVLTLDKELMAGDKIAITAFRNKNATEKVSGAKLKFEKGSTQLTTGDGKEFKNINAAVEGEPEYGDPNTIILTVPADAAGSKTITMTRSNTGTNLFITKIEITRPIEYYLVGNFNMDGENWVLGDEEYKLTKNEEAEVEEYSITVALPASTELKVWKNTDVWFPAEAGNFTINDAGTYTIYFRPNADGGDDWYQNCIYAQWVHGAVTLNEVEDNTNILTDWNGRTADVTLTRTLQTGGWNTFAVPFNQEIPNEWTVKELASTSFNGETLTLTFQDATSFVAGKPYLVKVPGTVENQTFYNVTISNEVAATETDYVDFIPTLGKTEISATGGITKENVLFIGEGNKLYNPLELPAEMKGFRAYFLLKGVNAARSFVLDFGDGETTGIIEIETMKNVANQAVYDLQGRRVNNAVQKGVYIVNGKKTVIK